MRYLYTLAEGAYSDYSVHKIVESDVKITREMWKSWEREFLEDRGVVKGAAPAAFRVCGHYYSKKLDENGYYDISPQSEEFLDWLKKHEKVRFLDYREVSMGHYDFELEFYD